MGKIGAIVESFRKMLPEANFKEISCVVGAIIAILISIYFISNVVMMMFPNKGPAGADIRRIQQRRVAANSRRRPVPKKLAQISNRFKPATQRRLR